MSCKPAADCAPCQDCPPSPSPVVPRCQDVVLTDGVYTNATVTIENGCITIVAEGAPFLYDPDSCCAVPGGGGGGGEGLDGPPGPPGAAATIQVGTVSGTAPGTPPTVNNSGTSSNAIFDFTIPRGADGADGASPSGVTDASAGIIINQGQVQGIPVTWPPLLIATTNVDDPNVTLLATKDDTTGTLTITLSMAAFTDMLEAMVDAKIAAAIAPIDTQIATLQSDVATIQSTCCP